MPECALHFIYWYLRLASARKSGINGAEPIGDAEIWYWQKNSGERLTSKEVDILISMDGAYRTAIHEEQEARHESKKAGS